MKYLIIQTTGSILHDKAPVNPSFILNNCPNYENRIWIVYGICLDKEGCHRQVSDNKNTYYCLDKNCNNGNKFNNISCNKFVCFDDLINLMD